MKKKYSIILSLQIIFLITSCSKPDSINSYTEPVVEPINYTYRIPETTQDGWEVSSLDSVNINKAKIEGLIYKIANQIGFSEIHSVIIIKDGKLVLDEYFPGHDFYYRGVDFHGSMINFDRDTPHNTHSATKSIVSALTGIAIDKCFIDSIETRIFEYFEDYSALITEAKNKITIEHLLTMSSGFDWNEWTVSPGDPEYDTYLFNISNDPIEYIFSKPIVSEPGTLFNYNGATVDLLGEIIRVSTGMEADEFSGKYLFSKLGISKFQWQRLSNSGLLVAHGDIDLCPRDMAKFGFLYMNGGVWDASQIISEQWVQESITGQIPLPPLSWADRYGYLWWIKDYEYNGQTIESFKAMGWGGQEIIAFPSLDMVVVFTGANYTTNPPIDNIISQYILPSLK